VFDRYRPSREMECFSGWAQEDGEAVPRRLSARGATRAVLGVALAVVGVHGDGAIAAADACPLVPSTVSGPLATSLAATTTRSSTTNGSIDDRYGNDTRTWSCGVSGATASGGVPL